MRDNKSKLGQVLFGAAAASLPAWTTTITGATIDLQGGTSGAPFNAACLYIVAGTWTDGTHAFKLQDSPDGTTWTDVAVLNLSYVEVANSAGGLPITIAAPAALTFATYSSVATALNTRVGYLGGQRYVRFVATLSGITSGAKYLPVWILGEPRVMPCPV